MFPPMRTGTPHPKFSTRGGFTLAELLVVIAIIGIMFAIALPALVNMTGASKLDAATNAVHSAAKLARQYAITQGQPTYLVFNEDKHSYAVFTINTHIQPVTQASGEFLTGWESLPAGIVFDHTSAGDDNMFNINTGAGWNGALSENNLLLIGGDEFVVAGFSPKGETSTSQYWTRRLLLAEGFYNESDQLIHSSQQGNEIHIYPQGKSQITSVLYNENGEPQELLK